MVGRGEGEGRRVSCWRMRRVVVVYRHGFLLGCIVGVFDRLGFVDGDGRVAFGAGEIRMFRWRGYRSPAASSGVDTGCLI